MSYRRSYGYRRRSFGGGGYRKKSSGARVRRSLKAQIAGTVDTLVTSALSIPVDSTRNVGINIHEFIVEDSTGQLIATPYVDGDYDSVWLNRNTPTQERFVSDIDYICGVGEFVVFVNAANGVHHDRIDRFRKCKNYPPIPVFQDEIRLCAYNHRGVAVTYYTETVYTLAWMSVGQIMGIAKNIII